MSTRKTRQRNRLESIHDPPDPSPRALPRAMRERWGEKYRQAHEIYGKDDLASRTAWREMTLHWRQTGEETWDRCGGDVCYWPSPMDLPMPKTDLVALGVLLEYVYLNKKGEIYVVKYDDHPPILWWDDAGKALYAFPKAEYPAECKAIPGDMKDALETYERWHQRKPSCMVDVDVPEVRIMAVGAADSLSYASDKWDVKNPDPRLTSAQQYIHEHWYDVWLWQDTTRTTPNAVMIHGGELDLHERGLIH